MKVRKISIDVAENDTVDIRCGGPYYLGFDFTVESKTLDYWRRFLTRMKKKRTDFPLFRVSISRPFDREGTGSWKPEKIEEEILNYTI